MKAWRNLPKEGGTYSPFSQVKQGPDEDYHAFISRLLEAVERVIGDTSTEMKDPLIKQLAFDNANASCKALLKGNMAGKSIHDMIDICRDADPITHRVVHALAAYQSQSSGKVCYSCGQAGHFSAQCSQRLAPVIQTSTTTPRKPWCPRCRRGKHWLKECVATTDVEGNPLEPNPRLSKQGNSSRARGFQGPRQIQRFVPASEPTQPAHSAPAPVPTQAVPPPQAYYQQHQQPCHYQAPQPLVPPSLLPPQQPSLCVQPPARPDWTSAPPSHTS